MGKSFGTYCGISGANWRSTEYESVGERTRWMLLWWSWSCGEVGEKRRKRREG